MIARQTSSEVIEGLNKLVGQWDWESRVIQMVVSIRICCGFASRCVHNSDFVNLTGGDFFVIVDRSSHKIPEAVLLKD